MELLLLLRRTHRIAIPVLRKIFFASGAIFLAGCSSVPSAYNPIDWTKSSIDEVSSWFESKPAPEGVSFEPPPAEGRPYPNLAMVPKPPPRVTAEMRAQRQREIDDLMASRQTALAADASLRATGAMPMAAEPPPAPVFLPPSSVAPASPAVPAPAVTPSLPPQAAAVPVAPSPVVAQRVGSVAFTRNATTLSAASQNTLQTAARSAAGAARVRLVPAQMSREAAAPELGQARAQAMVEALRRAGLTADRIAIASDMGTRVDVYDVYVER